MAAKKVAEFKGSDGKTYEVREKKSEDVAGDILSGILETAVSIGTLGLVGPLSGEEKDDD